MVSVGYKDAAGRKLDRMKFKGGIWYWYYNEVEKIYDVHYAMTIVLDNKKLTLPLKNRSVLDITVAT